MKLKFVSDGTREGTLIVDAKTNEIVEGVQNIKVIEKVDECRLMIIEVVIPEVDFTIKDFSYGTVKYVSMNDSKGHAYNCLLTDGDGNKIHNIYSVKIDVDFNGVRMVLGKVSKDESLLKDAEYYRELWGKEKIPKEFKETLITPRLTRSE